MQEKKRIEWLDMVRGIAIMMVVMCHVSTGLYFFADVSIQQRPILTQVVGFSLFTLGRLGVPLFLFISGYLLLPRSYDDKSCFRFWKNHFLKLLLLTEIWIVFYNIFKSWFNQTPFSLVTLAKNMLFLKPTDMSHMWYLPMILGVYLMIPFVSVVLHKFNVKTLVFPLAVVIVYAFGIPTVNVVLNAKNYSLVSKQLFLEFTGGVYGCYLIMGYLVYKGFFNKVNKIYLIVGMCLSLVITVTGQIYSSKLGTIYYVWYDFIFLFSAAICLFCLLKERKCSEKVQRIWNLLSRCSFGIYLIHEPVRAIVIKNISFGNISIHFETMLIWGITFITSWLIVYMLSKIPGIGKVLFLMK